MTEPVLFHPFTHRHELSDEALRAHLGGKGAGLALMAGELGLDVPPGFTLTTDACRRYQTEGWSDALDAALRAGLAGLEAATGRRLGDPERPLLVSVRSGAPRSMPGMLDTFLDVGLVPETRPALARRCAEPAAGEAFVRSCEAHLAEAFTAAGADAPPGDAWTQLRQAVEAVLRSVDSSRAAAYRAHESIDEALVTAVNVQAMVFGNLDDDSATGVVFSRDPATGEPRRYGDVLFRAQGEDVVAGRRRSDRIERLAQCLPEAAASLDRALTRLERRLRDVVEVEFTIERGRLWLLQVRVGQRSPAAALRVAIDLAEDPDFPLTRREAVERVATILADPPRLSAATGATDAPRIGQGLGASPGIAVGEVVVDVAEARAIAAARGSGDERPFVLVRPETAPQDVEGMAGAAGLLTARGGLASHAAVIARAWGVPAVVGVEDLEIDATGVTLGGTRVALGETISLDGRTGAVHAGRLAADERIVPEAERLLEWAREEGVVVEGIDAANTGAATASMGPPGTLHAAGAIDAAGALDAAGAVDEAELVRMLAIKGSATGEALAEACEGEAVAVETAVEGLAERGELEPARPLGWTLAEQGRTRAEQLLEVDRAALGVDLARSALETFQPLDARLKQAVTDWQLRPVDGELAPNDHRDEAWDTAVVAALAKLVDEANAWITQLAGALPRLGRYRARLVRAREAVTGGDARYVASPRVDSLHGVWFELHEDLIRLAGSSRSEEQAAGRAG